jgi:hypothetical protein
MTAPQMMGRHHLNPKQTQSMKHSHLVSTLRIALAVVTLGGIAGISTLRADDGDGGCSGCGGHKCSTNAPTPVPAPSPSVN